MADADLLLVVLAALQDPECGVRTFKKSKPLKRARNCFLGGQVVDALKAMGLDERAKATEIGLRLLDAGLVSVWEARTAGWSDTAVYAFSDYVVMDRTYVSEELPAALTYFSITAYVPRAAGAKPNEQLYGPVIAKRRPLAFGTISSPISTSTSNSPADASRFLEDDSDEIVFMLTGEDPIPAVKAGTVEKLVERLTYDKFIDLRFQDRFLMAYRTCISSGQLLQMLIDRFTTTSPLDANAGEAAESEWLKRRKLVQLRTLSVLSRWIVTQFETDWLNEEMKLHMFVFIDEHVAGQYDTLALQLRNNYQKGHEAMLSKQARHEPPSLPELRAASALQLDDTNVEATAAQLTLHESHLFSVVSPNELLSFGWAKKTQEERGTSRNVLRVIHFFNTISAWAVAEIVTRIQLTKRVQTLQRFIHLAQKLRELNNFNGAMAVGAALLSSPVQRLTQTWSQLPDNWTHVASDLQSLFSYSHSYRNYRAALKSASMPCLPYLGLFLTDLTFIAESQPNKLENGLINFYKMSQFARVCSELQRYQMVHYRLPPNRPLLASILLVKVPLSGEDEAYEMSLKVEPRNQKESFEQMLINEEKLRAELRQYVVRTADLESENSRLKAELAVFDEQLRAVLRTRDSGSLLQNLSDTPSRQSLAKQVRTRLKSERLPTSPLANPDAYVGIALILPGSRQSDSTRPASMSDQLLMGLRMPGSSSSDGDYAARTIPRPSPLSYISPNSLSPSPSPPSPMAQTPPSPASSVNSSLVLSVSSQSISSVSSASGSSGAPSPLATSASSLTHQRVKPSATEPPRPASPGPGLANVGRTASIVISRGGSAEGARAAPNVSDTRAATFSIQPQSKIGPPTASQSPRKVAWWEKDKDEISKMKKDAKIEKDQSSSTMLAWWEVLQKPEASPSAPPLALASPTASSVQPSVVAQSPSHNSSSGSDGTVPSKSPLKWRPGKKDP